VVGFEELAARKGRNMDNNNYNYIIIKAPKDVRRLMQRVINSVLRSGQEAEFAGKICNLANTWLKAYEIEKVFILERRIKDLEDRK
jgi:hypothetical protein